MIKKQLGVLAGSVLMAASANSAIVAGSAGTDSSAILVLSAAGQGAFVIETGLTASDLAAGNGFSVDISAAATFLGGTIDSYALFGVIGGSGSTYSYTSNSYVEEGAGVVYAGSTEGGVQTSDDGTSANAGVRTYISNVLAGGGFAEGTAGDLDGQTFAGTLYGVGVLNGAGITSSLFAQTINQASGSSDLSGAIDILNPDAAVEGAYIDGTNFVVSNFASGPTVVPVPAAAWLFGSALLGLGVVRRKKS